VYLAICELLLSAGASTSLGVRDKSGRTALDWAKDGRPPEIVKLISTYSHA
jgi:ankyrin repeat protein